MKQQDKLSFVDATEKDINSQESGGHWLIVHYDNLPNKSRLIKTI